MLLTILFVKSFNAPFTFPFVVNFFTLLENLAILLSVYLTPTSFPCCFSWYDFSFFSKAKVFSQMQSNSLFFSMFDLFFCNNNASITCIAFKLVFFNDVFRVHAFNKRVTSPIYVLHAFPVCNMSRLFLHNTSLRSSHWRCCKKSLNLQRY